MSEPPALLSHLLVPVATEQDARKTARALGRYDPDAVTVAHVVDRDAGVPTDIPPDQPQSVAAAAFRAFHQEFPEAETKTVFGQDVVDGVVEAAAAVDASAIAFQPREGSRLAKFLAGDHSLALVRHADRPVISLPDSGD